MLALGLGVIAFVIFGALFRAALALGAAYALTTLTALPGVVDVLVWFGAGGFALIQLIGAFVTIAIMVKAGDAQRHRYPAPRARRGLR